ncbi:uncharacterized protein LOC135515507 [Oncorhynchus masou masou]|uniref:uncharacterized protein LOC135515507 n=1 Tax=Oncorhynchus masou masou TaxID=90313 RepID=UPI003182D7CC
MTVEYHVTGNVDHMVWYKMTTGKKLQCVAEAEIVTKHAHYFVILLSGSLCLSQSSQETIHTETCAGEHSVYWFRHGSGESHPEAAPGIISTHGDRSDQCEKSPEAASPTQSCVYNFPKRNLTPSDAGTYYCAVASSGEILFGNGTKLDIQGRTDVPTIQGQSVVHRRTLTLTRMPRRQNRLIPQYTLEEWGGLWRSSGASSRPSLPRARTLPTPPAGPGNRTSETYPHPGLLSPPARYSWGEDLR